MASFFQRFARQWIAGDTIADGINRTREANSQGFLGLLNLLGEHVKNQEQINATVKEYTKLLEQIDESKVKSQISIKPSQFGMSLDYDLCLRNYLNLAETCRSHSDNWLWVDMEDSPYTEKTITLYKQVLAKYPNTGVAVQSYLRRSENDVRGLLDVGGNIRLVKGAYNEPRGVAYKSKKEVSESYANLTRMMFEHPGKHFFAVATHDGKLVEYAKSLSKQNSTSFEFEMLMGVRDRLKTELVRENYQVREYIPYGPEWFAYSMRRMREKKSNIFLLLRSLFSS